MAIVFAVRGDDLDARYSNNGATGALLGATQPVLAADATSINGVNSIDLVNAGLGYRGIAYPGDTNTPSGKARSMLFRVKFASTGAQGIGGIGGFHRNPVNFMGLSLTATPEITVTISNELGQVDTGTTTSSGIGTTAWHDIGVSFTGDTTASGMLVAVDGVIKLTDTMTRSLPTFDANARRAVFTTLMGPNYTANNTHFLLDEMVVWDTTQDFTASDFALTSGAGALDGAARTAYLDVDAVDGLADSQAGGAAGPTLLGGNRGGFS
jgi:hypothetical protein